MNSSNPFTMMMNMMGRNGIPGIPGMPNIPNVTNTFNANNLMPNQNSQNFQIPPLNQAQFKQFLPNIDDNILKQLVQQAHNQGISDNDIIQGLNFIKGMK